MTSGKTGTWEITGSKGITGRLTWAEEYDIPINTHRLSVSLAIKSAQAGRGYTYFLGTNDGPGYLSLDGEQFVKFDNIAGSHYVRIPSGSAGYADVQAASGYPAAPWLTTQVTGEDGGACSVILGVNVYGFSAGSPSNSWHLHGSQTIELTPLPRASSIGGTDAYIGSVCAVTIGKKATAYTSEVGFTFGTMSGYLDSDGNIVPDPVRISASSIPWRIPESFYDEIPNTPSAECTLSCRTLSGDTQMGAIQYSTCRLTADPALCRPYVTGSAEDHNTATVPLTGDPAVAVRYKSDMICAMGYNAVNGATIKATYINGKPEPGRAVLLGYEGGPIVFSAVDSRGYRSDYTVTPQLVPYVILSCNPTVARDDPTSGRATLTATGDYYNGSFGAAVNELYISYTVDGGPAQTATAAISGNRYTVRQQLEGLDYRRRHTVTVTVADKLAHVIKSATVDMGYPLFAWGADRFDFYIPVNLIGGVVGVMEDPDHPGCYYRIAGREREWVNPPMLTGRSYRTSRRFSGAPVYSRIDWCTLIPGGSVEIPLQGVDSLIRYGGTVGYGQPLPLIGAGGEQLVTVECVRGTGIAVRAAQTVPEWGCYLQIWFTAGAGFKPDDPAAILGIATLGKMILGD